MEHTTQLTYKANLEPDFFIPPLLGTQMVIENMRDEFSTTVSRIQHIAQVNEEREWNDDYEFTKVAKQQRGEPCDTDIIADFR